MPKEKKVPFVVTARFGKSNYSYLEVAESLENISKEIREGKIDEYMSLLNKYKEKDSSEDLEVVVLGKKCPDCGGRVLEKIGISEKNGKPYHRLKCEDPKCKWIKWMDVLSKSESSVLVQDPQPKKPA